MQVLNILCGRRLGIQNPYLCIFYQWLPFTEWLLHVRHSARHFIHISLALIIFIVISCRYRYDSHITDKEMESQRIWVTRPRRGVGSGRATLRPSQVTAAGGTPSPPHATFSGCPEKHGFHDEGSLPSNQQLLAEGLLPPTCDLSGSPTKEPGPPVQDAIPGFRLGLGEFRTWHFNASPPICNWPVIS